MDKGLLLQHLALDNAKLLSGIAKSNVFTRIFKHMHLVYYRPSHGGVDLFSEKMNKSENRCLQW